MSRQSRESEGPHSLARAVPVGKGQRVVTQGECIVQIAGDTGHFWETLWNHPENSELKRARKEPFLLMPGDRVHIPALREKIENCDLDQKHRFRRKGVPAKVRMCFRTDGEPLANREYRLIIDDGEVRTGKLDKNGLLDEPVPTNARKATVILEDSDEEIVYEIELGVLNPDDDRDGIVGRLANLGFLSSDDADDDEALADAIRGFQRAHGLDQTGEIDDATKDKILEVHGS